MAFAVKMPIGRALHAAIDRRRHADLSARADDDFNKVVIIVAFVGDQSFKLEAFNQPGGLRFVVPIAAR